MKEQPFYLQDNRSYVGNDVLWWAKDGKGYTTDLSNAHIYNKNDALAQHRCRESDVPWPKEYIDERTRPAVDMQYVCISDALEGTGIELTKPEKFKKEVIKCWGCGRFISEFEVYNDCCNYCGCDNRP